MHVKFLPGQVKIQQTKFLKACFEAVCEVFSVCVCVCVQVLLPAAGLLQLQEVKKACCEFLITQLHPTNCLGIRAFADLHACTELLNLANTYAGVCSSIKEKTEKFMHTIVIIVMFPTGCVSVTLFDSLNLSLPLIDTHRATLLRGRAE